MREPNDIKLAENVSDIDLILGGHDHHYEIKEVTSRWLFSLSFWYVMTDIPSVELRNQTNLNMAKQTSSRAMSVFKPRAEHM